MTRTVVALDDPDAIAGIDTGGMLALAAALGDQLRQGFETARSTPELPSAEGLRSVVVCGMGGSGVAGDVLRSLYAGRLHVPIVVAKGYQLPEFCGRDTLVLAMSFSGNTEETLAAYSAAVERGCRAVAVCAGGELAMLAEADDVARVPLPPEIPVPRAALGYLAAAPLGVLDAMGLLPRAAEDVAQTADLLDALADKLGPAAPTSSNEAKSLAGWLEGRIPVIWGTEGLAEAPALRWKTQINENAKLPAWAAVLSELDHNEIEGWSEGTGQSYGLIILRHRHELPRIGRRVEATLDAVAGAGLATRQLWGPGDNPMEALFSLVMIGDFVATYLAVARGVDPTPIPVLSSLKERLKR